MASGASDSDKLESIKELVQSLVRQKLALLQNEASVLSADMDALVRRMERHGSEAKVEDLKAGRWYRTAAELRLLQLIYRKISEVSGRPIEPVVVAALHGEGDGVVTEEADLDEVTEGEG